MITNSPNKRGGRIVTRNKATQPQDAELTFKSKKSLTRILSPPLNYLELVANSLQTKAYCTEAESQVATSPHSPLCVAHSVRNREIAPARLTGAFPIPAPSPCRLRPTSRRVHRHLGVRIPPAGGASVLVHFICDTR